MITTTQVRAVIAKHRQYMSDVYTNKTTGHTGSDRRVKCYFRNDTKLFKALQKAAGKENVTITAGTAGAGMGRQGIVVKCVLA